LGHVGSEDGEIASLPEKFEAELNLAGGCGSACDCASGSGKTGRVRSSRRREDNQVWRVEIGSVQ